MKVVLKDTIITRRKPIMLGVRNYARDYYCAEIITRAKPHGSGIAGKFAGIIAQRLSKFHAL